MSNKLKSAEEMANLFDWFGQNQTDYIRMRDGWKEHTPTWEAYDLMVREYGKILQKIEPILNASQLKGDAVEVYEAISKEEWLTTEDKSNLIPARNFATGEPLWLKKTSIPSSENKFIEQLVNEKKQLEKTIKMQSDEWKRVVQENERLRSSSALNSDAVAFAEWLGNKQHEDPWFKYQKFLNKWYLKFSGGHITTSELYQIFLKDNEASDNKSNQ